MENVTLKIKNECAGRLNRTAISCSGRAFTYAQLFEGCDSFAKILRSKGIKRHDIVAFHAPNSYEYIAFSLALLEMGAVLAPVPFEMHETELAGMCFELNVNAVITADVNMVSGLRQPKWTLPEKLSGNDGFVMTMRTDSPKPFPEFTALNPAFIRFSSGTTAGSKGVVLSHRTVIERTDNVRANLKLSESDSVLWVLSMAYHFVATIISFLRSGVMMTICPEPALICMGEKLKSYSPTIMYATPYHYRFMAESKTFGKEAVSSARLIISTAMQLDVATAEAFHAKFRRKLTQVYGIIECGLPCADTDESAELIPGCVGKPGKGYEISIENPDADDSGVILVRGSGMFDAYFYPFSLSGQVCRDGWFNTGDIGRMLPDGRLQITGRSKNVIIFAGMKIFPYEVENTLRLNPLVKEAVVYGETQEAGGELPVAEIVLRKEQITDDMTDDYIASELRRHCYDSLEPQKVPKKFIFVGEIRKTLSGKILRHRQNKEE